MNYTKEQLNFIGERIPELALAKVPSKEDDPRLIDVPSLDNVIILFLQKFEIYVKPKRLKSWNGWDTLSVVSSFFAANSNNYQASLRNISDTIFYSNRSNQVQRIAQKESEDWTNWKRWTLDHKEFPEFKYQMIDQVKKHNQIIYNELDSKISKAEEYNNNILKKLRDLVTQ